jgi:hypothetical protein
MVNSGVCHAGPKSKMFFTGGLNSLLPFLEILTGIYLMNKENEILSLDTVFNEYLKLVSNAQSSAPPDSNFFLMFFHLW